MSRRPRVPRTKTVFILPPIDDSLDEATKNAIAIRNACATEGVCPGCGAVGAIHADPKFEGIFHYTFSHEGGCSALIEDAA